MKKLLVFFLLFAFAVFLFSCSDKNGIDSPMGGWDKVLDDRETEAEWDFSLDGSTVHYIRAGHSEDTDLPFAFVIDSKLELDGYIAHYGEGNSRLRSIFTNEKYSQEFFSENVIVIALLEEVSGSISHELMDITHDGEILIKRIVPEAGTCDIARWQVAIELPLDVAKNMDFTVKYYGE